MSILRYFRKVLLLIASGATTVIIAACYGVGTVIDQVVNITVTDSVGAPIEGLRVEVNCTGGESDVAFTNAEGEGLIYLPEYTDLSECTAGISDVDGHDGGGSFEDTSIELNDTDGEYNVELTEG